MIVRLLYNDYTNLNVDLIDEYDLDLSVFYDEYTYPESKITEIPIEDLNLLVDKMSAIIENSKKGTEYLLEINSIKAFIEDATKYCLEELRELIE